MEVIKKSIDVVRKSMDRPHRTDFADLDSHNEETRFRFKWPFFALALRSLGVIYGDIGTSPLYVMNTIFTTPPTPDQVIGGCSLVVWSLLILVTLKYVVFILQANNRGEGGTFALASLLIGEESSLAPRWKTVAVILSTIGAALVIGDGALTPAISVLSAIEGLEVANTDFTPYVEPVTIVILILLFLAQRFGTSKVGITFGPIMCIWFLALFLIGCYHLRDAPIVFRALDPWEAIRFLYTEGTDGFLALGAVFLAVTGLEALFADLGHFGPASIRVSWLFVVLPSLIINYLGQGALIINDVTTYDAPFYKSIPISLYWPMFVLATLATIIASQAMITGCFSLVSQAISLGFFPPVTVKHTSKKIIGQIYLPEVNFFLMVLTVLVIVGFQHSANITQAYGVTVCSVMCLTSVMFMGVMRYTWHMPWWKVTPFFLFLIVDLFFLASNYVKIPNGGWVSIFFGFIFTSIMLIWYYGEKELKKSTTSTLQSANISSLKKALKDDLGVEDEKVEDETYPKKEKVIKSISFKTFTMKEENDESDSEKSDSAGSDSGPKNTSSIINMDGYAAVSVLPKGVRRLPGVGVFLSPSRRNVPTVFQLFVNYIQGVPETIIFLTLEHVNIPFVPAEYKTEVINYGSGIYRVIARYGYAENKVKITEVMNHASNHGLEAFETYTIYFNATRIQIKRKNLFLKLVLYIYSFMKKLFTGTLNNFKLPSTNVMAVGVQVEL